MGCGRARHHDRLPDRYAPLTLTTDPDPDPDPNPDPDLTLTLALILTLTLSPTLTLTPTLPLSLTFTLSRSRSCKGRWRRRWTPPSEWFPRVLVPAAPVSRPRTTSMRGRGRLHRRWTRCARRRRPVRLLTLALTLPLTLTLTLGLA